MTSLSSLRICATTLTILAGIICAEAKDKDLKTEITVDRTIVPVEREAVRLGSLSPRLLSAPVNMRQLSLADYTDPAAITRSLSTLAPAAYADTFALSPYRGYASVGYFPIFNLGASAGYRFIDNARTRLGAWLQYDGYNYKPYADGDETSADGKYSDNTVSIGASLHQRVGSHSSLGAQLGYTHSAVGLPDNFTNHSQSADILDANLSWLSRSRLIGYRLAAGFSRFAYNKDCLIDFESLEIPMQSYNIKAPAENHFNFNAGVAFFGSSVSPRGGIDLSADFVSRSNGADASETLKLSPISDKTLGVVSATPYFAFHSGRIHGRIGARVDISVGGEGKKLHIAPDVMLDWNAANQLAIYLKLNGGEHLNTLRSLYDYCPYVAPIWQYGRSNIPVTADLGINIGPFSGFSAKIFGGYAQANDWLMPQLIFTDVNAGITTTNYGSYDLKGWHAGVALAYDWQSKVKATLSAETASNDCDKAYYLWRDRAKYVINAGIEVRPISPLSIAIGYELRTGRHNYCGYPSQAENLLKLHSLSNLSLSASYRLTDAWTVSLRGENLLNHHYNLVTDIQARPIHALASISYKF